MLEAKTNAKPLALLIPGLDGTGKLFCFQLEALARKYRVCAWSYQAGADFDLADLTGKLAAATEGEAPGSILVVAESFGGLVALDFVLRCPDRVRRLIMANTFPYHPWRLRLRLAQTLMPLLDFGAARQVRHFIIDRVLRSEGIPAEGRLQFQEVIEQIDLKGYRRRLQLIRETDLRPRLAEVAVPTVLLASARDKLVPSILEARFMASRIPSSRMHEFPNAGHALMLTPGISLANYEAESLQAAEPGHSTSNISDGRLSS